MSTCDHYLGRLLGALEKYNLRDETIILFTSDDGHSEEDYQINVDNHMAGMTKGVNYGANGGGGNTGKWIGAKGSFLEGGIRVPAILSYPKKLPSNEVRDQAVTIMDWYPTLLDLCEVDRPDNIEFDGRSAWPIIKNSDAASAHQQLYWQWQNGWTVRDGDWKLIANGNYGLGQPKLPKIYLSNLAEDEPEARNHAEARPEIVERLNDLHEAWAKDVFRVYQS